MSLAQDIRDAVQRASVVDTPYDIDGWASFAGNNTYIDSMGNLSAALSQDDVRLPQLSLAIDNAQFQPIDYQRLLDFASLQQGSTTGLWRIAASNAEIYPTMQQVPIQQTHSGTWFQELKKSANAGSTEIEAPGMVVRNRSNAFESFMSGIKGFVRSFLSTGEFKVHQTHQDSKKRVKYWASRMFEPTKFRFSRIVYVNSSVDGTSKIDTKDVNNIFEVVPIGLDIWTTLGEMGGNGTMDWDKTMFFFIPSKPLLGVLGRNDIPFAFAMASSIKMPTSEDLEEEQPRHIDL